MALLEMLLGLAVTIALAIYADFMFHWSPTASGSTALLQALKEVGIVVLVLFSLLCLAAFVCEYRSRLELRRLDNERTKLEAEYPDCRIDLLLLNNAWLVTSRKTGKTVAVVPAPTR